VPLLAARSNGGGRRGLAVALAAVALVSLGEIKLRERLLYADASEMEFVRANVAGILQGRPVSKAWQQRVLAPLAVAALTRVTGSDLAAIRLLEDLLVAAANLLLFILVRRRACRPADAFLAVALFGFAHLLLMYRLEYPWDSVDVLIFMVFGAEAARGRRLASLWPLLLVGTLNHETVLYLPLWYVVAGPRRTRLRAAATGVALGAAILMLRQALYRGRPDFPADSFGPALPLIANQGHLLHNLGQALFDDWRSGRIFIAGTLLGAIALFVRRARRGADPIAATWSLVVIATVFCFGYVNETRLYVPLLSFWATYLPAGSPWRTDQQHASASSSTR
jgi:hypothetical protein